MSGFHPTPLYIILQEDIFFKSPIIICFKIKFSHYVHQSLRWTNEININCRVKGKPNMLMVLMNDKYMTECTSFICHRLFAAYNLGHCLTNVGYSWVNLLHWSSPRKINPEQTLSLLERYFFVENRLKIYWCRFCLPSRKWFLMQLSCSSFHCTACCIYLSLSFIVCLSHYPYIYLISISISLSADSPTSLSKCYALYLCLPTLSKRTGICWHGTLLT